MYQSIDPAACADKIRAAKHIVALTGAGVSTSAGVPDFRGPKGLYVTRAYDPETVFEISAFDKNPEPFYKFSRDFLGMLQGLVPSPTHRFLAMLEHNGKPMVIVTQNIDGLHQRAGSRHVLPMHGDYNTAHCRRCNKRMTGEELVARLTVSPEVPRCSCGGVIKPDVVFFGEPVRHLDDAIREVTAADLFLALGSSLSVYPAATLPLHTGGEVVVVNQGPIGLEPAPNVYRAGDDLDGFFLEVEAELGL